MTNNRATATKAAVVGDHRGLSATAAERAAGRAAGGNRIGPRAVKSSAVVAARRSATAGSPAFTSAPSTAGWRRLCADHGLQRRHSDQPAELAPGVEQPIPWRGFRSSSLVKATSVIDGTGNQAEAAQQDRRHHVVMPLSPVEPDSIHIASMISRMPERHGGDRRHTAGLHQERGESSSEAMNSALLGSKKLARLGRREGQHRHGE